MMVASGRNTSKKAKLAYPAGHPNICGLLAACLPAPTLVSSISPWKRLKWGRCAYSKAIRGAEGARKCGKVGRTAPRMGPTKMPSGLMHYLILSTSPFLAADQ